MLRNIDNRMGKLIGKFSQVWSNVKVGCDFMSRQQSNYTATALFLLNIAYLYFYGSVRPDKLTAE